MLIQKKSQRALKQKVLKHLDQAEKTICTQKLSVIENASLKLIESASLKLILSLANACTCYTKEMQINISLHVWFQAYKWSVYFLQAVNAIVKGTRAVQYESHVWSQVTMHWILVMGSISISNWVMDSISISNWVMCTISNFSVSISIWNWAMNSISISQSQSQFQNEPCTRSQYPQSQLVSILLSSVFVLAVRPRGCRFAIVCTYHHFHAPKKFQTSLVTASYLPQTFLSIFEQISHLLSNFRRFFGEKCPENTVKKHVFLSYFY